MSWQVNGVCYPTELAAAHATAALNNGSMYSTSAGVVEVMAANVTDVSIQYVLRNVSNSTQVQRTLILNPQPCELLTVADGIQLGWMVGAAWIGVYALLFLTRAFRGETESNYGNS